MAIFLNDCASYPVFMADCTTEVFEKVITTRFTLEVGEKQIVCKNIALLKTIKLLCLGGKTFSYGTECTRNRRARTQIN